MKNSSLRLSLNPTYASGPSRSTLHMVLSGLHPWQRGQNTEEEQQRLMLCASRADALCVQPSDAQLRRLTLKAKAWSLDVDLSGLSDQQPAEQRQTVQGGRIG